MEEMTQEEIKQFKKQRQTHSPKHKYEQLKQHRATRLTHPSTTHSNFPQTTRNDMSAPRLPMTNIARILQAGCIWDDELKRWMNLEDLLNHPNQKVRTTWEKSSQKEYGNLFQGFGDTKGMDVCNFIPKSAIPKQKKITYPRTVVAYRPEKVDNPYRTRITAGGDKLDYDGKTSTNSASMTTIKISYRVLLILWGTSMPASTKQCMD